MAKRYRPSGLIYTPVPEKKSDLGEILGGIALVIFILFLLASCVG